MSLAQAAKPTKTEMGVIIGTEILQNRTTLVLKQKLRHRLKIRNRKMFLKTLEISRVKKRNQLFAITATNQVTKQHFVVKRMTMVMLNHGISQTRMQHCVRLQRSDAAQWNND
jgi:hypothetical protein